jgi:hypothetical protein
MLQDDHDWSSILLLFVQVVLDVLWLIRERY